MKLIAAVVAAGVALGVTIDRLGRKPWPERTGDETEQTGIG